MSDVFISHVEEDAEIALEIALGLEEAGYTTWCYEVDNIPGLSYLIQTGQAVEQAKALVLIISPHSLGSHQVTKEVIRAHETGKEFIPVLQDITHIEFQNRQPEWREALGAASSIRVPMEGVTDIIPRIITGLKASGILPGSQPEAAHIAQIRKSLGNARGRAVSGEAVSIPHRGAMAEPVQAVKAITHPNWFWAAMTLFSIGFVILLMAVLTPPPLEPGEWWGYSLILTLIVVLPFIAVGACFLRRGMAQEPQAVIVRGKIPGWWWLLPAILGFVGAIICWASQKNINRYQAMNMLTLGILTTLLWTIPFFVPHATPAPSSIPSVPTPATAPEAQPTAPSSGLIYEDDFSNPSSGWLRHSTEESDLDYKDGEYHFLVKKSGLIARVWCPNAVEVTDFALEIEARLVSGANDTYYGVFFRAQDRDNFYHIFISGDGYYLIGVRLKGVWTELQSKTRSDFIKEGNSINHIRVTCRGSQIEVAVNGQNLTSVADDSFTEGRVGMIVNAPEPDTLVAFDNIKVYSLE